MFFTQFNQLMAGSVDITLVIRKSATGMTVSVLPKSNGLKDEAQNHIVPLTLSGTPEELDGGFFQTIARPMQKVSGLLTNMAEFEKQADKTAKDSKAAKEAKAKETKEEKEKREKYEKLMKKADELATAKNHKEAVTVLGQAKAYANPQQTKEIEEKSRHRPPNSTRAACSAWNPLTNSRLHNPHRSHSRNLCHTPVRYKDRLRGTFRRSRIRQAGGSSLPDSRYRHDSLCSNRLLIPEYNSHTTRSLIPAREDNIRSRAHTGSSRCHSRYSRR